MPDKKNLSGEDVKKIGGDSERLKYPKYEYQKPEYGFGGITDSPVGEETAPYNPKDESESEDN